MGYYHGYFLYKFTNYMIKHFGMVLEFLLVGVNGESFIFMKCAIFCRVI